MMPKWSGLRGLDVLACTAHAVVQGVHEEHEARAVHAHVAHVPEARGRRQAEVPRPLTYARNPWKGFV